MAIIELLSLVVLPLLYHALLFAGDLHVKVISTNKIP